MAKNNVRPMMGKLVWPPTPDQWELVNSMFEELFKQIRKTDSTATLGANKPIVFPPAVVFLEDTMGEDTFPIPGPAGLTGPIGLQGPAGEDGLEGEIGPPGIQGMSGVQGIQGIAGPAGDDGIDGEVGPPGLTGATGAQGPQGNPGATGATGPMGPPGIADDGLDADPAYQVVPVVKDAHIAALIAARVGA